MKAWYECHRSLLLWRFRERRLRQGDSATAQARAVPKRLEGYQNPKMMGYPAIRGGFLATATRSSKKDR